MISVLTAGLGFLLASAATVRSLSGTISVVEDTRPARVMVRADRQFQTFQIAERAIIERQTSFAGRGASTTVPIDPLDLTPGESVRLQLDAQDRIVRARAIALLERANVRSAGGRTVVLEDGTRLTIGSLLRFVTADGKPSATATVRPGESVVLFRHPETRNIYRFSALANVPRPAKTPRPPTR